MGFDLRPCVMTQLRGSGQDVRLLLAHHVAPYSTKVSQALATTERQSSR